MNGCPTIAGNDVNDPWRTYDPSGFSGYMRRNSTIRHWLS